MQQDKHATGSKSSATAILAADRRAMLDDPTTDITRYSFKAHAVRRISSSCSIKAAKPVASLGPFLDSFTFLFVGTLPKLLSNARQRAPPAPAVIVLVAASRIWQERRAETARPAAETALSA